MGIQLFETKSNNLKAKLLLGATTFAALGFSGAAFGQQATEMVVVTGSRIPQAGVEGASPVTTVSAEDVKLQGTTSVGDLLKNLPATVNDGDSDSVTNGTAGLATIDLRNLGTKRTLVLVDGKRLVAGDQSLNVDTNVIPAGMVDRVEVLTGGDSSVYGSDAVAGVVNIILKKNFEGLQFDSQVNITGQGDGTKHERIWSLLGINSGDGKRQHHHLRRIHAPRSGVEIADRPLWRPRPGFDQLYRLRRLRPGDAFTAAIASRVRAPCRKAASRPLPWADPMSARNHAS